MKKKNPTTTTVSNTLGDCSATVTTTCPQRFLSFDTRVTNKKKKKYRWLHSALWDTVVENVLSVKIVGFGTTESQVYIFKQTESYKYRSITSSITWLYLFLKVQLLIAF